MQIYANSANIGPRDLNLVLFGGEVDGEQNIVSLVKISKIFAMLNEFSFETENILTEDSSQPDVFWVFMMISEKASYSL